MKRSLLLLVSLVLLASCAEALTPGEQVYVKKRAFLRDDPAAIQKPRFVSLPAGAVKPEGWIRDWAVDASHGITGHLDEWSPTYGMAWKGVGFEARGADPKTGLGWPLEQCAYWLDGGIRLAYILGDTALIGKVSRRLHSSIVVRVSSARAEASTASRIRRSPLSS